MITVKHGVFHLQNEKSSYLFRVRDGFLEHLHFGTRPVSYTHLTLPTNSLV